MLGKPKKKTIAQPQWHSNSDRNTHTHTHSLSVVYDKYTNATTTKSHVQLLWKFKSKTRFKHTHIYIDHINIRLYERGRATKLNKQQDKNEWTNQRKSEEKQYIKIMMMMVQQIYTQNKNTRLFGLFSIKARNNKKISQFPLIFFLTICTDNNYWFFE